MNHCLPGTVSRLVISLYILQEKKTPQNPQLLIFLKFAFTFIYLCKHMVLSVLWEVDSASDMAWPQAKTWTLEKTLWCWIPALPFTSCVTLGKLLHLSVSQYTHL